MKTKKIKKILSSSFGVGTTIAVGIALVSCAQQHTWDDFVIKVESENVINVVRITKPTGWISNVKRSELKFGNFNIDINSESITVDITRTLSTEPHSQSIASFKIKFNHHQEYHLNWWKCTSEPKPIVN